jgi:uncharacterized membrane protein YgcG
MGVLAILIGVLHVFALFSAYQIGRQTELPVEKWPKGSMLKGGWKAWRIPYMVIVGLAAAIAMFVPIFRAMGRSGFSLGIGRGGGGGGFGGGGFGGGGGGGYGMY